MKQTSEKRYTLDHLGSKTSIRVLRVLYQNLNRYLSISEISATLDTSRANVHRGIDSLDELGIIRRSKQRGRSLVRINTSSALAVPFFCLFNKERYMQVEPEIRNIASLLLAGSDRKKLLSLVLFGSQARGKAWKTSDIDLMAITDDSGTIKKIKNISKEFLPDHRIEVHGYDMEEINDPKDLVVIDSLLFGISFHGDEILFGARSDIDSIDTSYLIWRLRSCKVNLKRAKQVQGEARRYFERVARVTLGEIESILKIGQTVLKRDIKIKGKMEKRIKDVQEELAERGDRIWLN